MRTLLVCALALTLVIAGCGSDPEIAQTDVQSMPEDDVHAGVSGSPTGGIMGGLNTNIDIDQEIADAWTGIRVHVIDNESGNAQMIEIALGEVAPLGDSGLTLSVDTFVPDFVMDESGITSRSTETHNPAARVVISGEGMADYEGWLFAAMPEIHPFPHDRYQVLLVEGIPAG
jgi:hypothetical protein